MIEFLEDIGISSLFCNSSEKNLLGLLKKFLICNTLVISAGIYKEVLVGIPSEVLVLPAVLFPGIADIIPSVIPPVIFKGFLRGFLRNPLKDFFFED